MLIVKSLGDTIYTILSMSQSGKTMEAPGDEVPVLTPTPDEHMLLQNPREEVSFTKYYQNLDPEELLPVFTYSHSEIYSKILENTNGLDRYDYRQRRVDQIRSSKLKTPNFRKLVDLDFEVENKIKEIELQQSPENPRILRKLGFHNLETKNDQKLDLPATYFRPNLNNDSMVRGKLTYKSKHFQVLYDMDETDLLFVDWMNSVATQPVSPDLFEIIITFFETQIYQVERILPPTIKDRATIDYQQHQAAILYGSDDGKGCATQDEQTCAVCGSANSDSSNSIVFCDGCDIAVHQDCYGVSFIPEGPWLCRRCLIARNTDEKCEFCPSTTGAFKQTDGGDWAHVLCTLWTPELYFANPIYMEPVEGVANIPKSRWKLVCYICKQKVGVCIQCSKPSCFAAYHVTCAKRAELCMKYKKGIKGAIHDKGTLVSYCDKHTPIEWGHTHDVKAGINKTRLFFHDKVHKTQHGNTSAIEKTAVTEQEYKDLQSTKSTEFRWRLGENIYVIPEIFIDRLTNFIEENKLTNIPRNAMYQIAKYYTLKRKHMGKGLIKRPDVFNYAGMTMEQLNRRDEAVAYFQYDIGQLQETSKLVLKRSSKQKEINEVSIDLHNKLTYPKLWACQTLVNFLKVNLDSISYSIPKYAVKPTIDQIFQKVDNSEYTDIEILIKDIEKFCNWILSLSLNSNSPLVKVQKVFKIWQRYKKSKYQTARDFIKMVEDEWDLIKSQFVASKGLSYKAIDNFDCFYNERKRKHKKPKGVDGNSPVIRFGIEVSPLNEPSDNRRTLRTRRTPSYNDEAEKQIAEATKKGVGIKARLDRVKLRSNAQNLRKSKRLKSK